MRTTLILSAILFLTLLLASKTQSRTEQRINQIKFETCVNEKYSDNICDSCYQKVMTEKHWFNKKLYSNATIDIK